MRYLAVMAALIGAGLLAGTAYLDRTTRRSDQAPPRTGAVVVSASVQQATWAPIPNPSRNQTPTPRVTAEQVPPDPRTGPYPVCWVHPGQGLATGATCPPKPTGWSPPPG